MALVNNPKFGWTSFSGLFMVAYQTALLIGLPFYFAHNTPSWGLIGAALILFVGTQLGITAGYHRLFSHRAYTANRAIEAIMLFWGTLALQGSVMRWAFQHRLHHSYVDTDRDPYSIKKGFWYAHFLWIFDPSDPIDDKRVKDLIANPLVRFQDRWYVPLAVLSNVLVTWMVGWMLNDYVGAIALSLGLRLAVSHHLTFFINSLAHWWGEKSYSKELSAVDNHLIAFLTAGEGYHNYHHTFPNDYRNGVRWYHFDPAKWTIWTLSKLGLTKDLKRFSDVAIGKRLLAEDRKLLQKTLSDKPEAERSELMRLVDRWSEQLHDKLARLGTLLDELKALKRDRAEKATRKARRREMGDLLTSLRRDFRQWFRLCADMLEGRPAPAQPAA